MARVWDVSDGPADDSYSQKMTHLKHYQEEGEAFKVRFSEGPRALSVFQTHRHTHTGPFSLPQYCLSSA